MWLPLAFLDKALGFSRGRWGHWARLNWPRQHTPGIIWSLHTPPAKVVAAHRSTGDGGLSLIPDAKPSIVSPLRGRKNFKLLFFVVGLARGVGRRVSRSVSLSHFPSPLPRLLRASPAVVCVGEGCASLRNTRSLHPLLSPAHVNPLLGAAIREVWWMRVSSDAYWFIFFFTNTHSLCWVTHGCCLFKKPSTWIYIVTSGSGSPHLCQCNGEGWLLKMLTGIKRKGN